MNHRLSRLHVLSWPIWLKLSAAFAAAVLLPLALIVLAVQPALREIGLQNLRSFMSENGERQHQAIVSVLEQSRTNINLFVNNASYIRRVNNLLLSASPLLNSDQAVRVDEDEVAALFRDVLLNRSTTQFNSIRLLDRRGHLVVQSSLDTLNADEVQQDQSRSEAYRAALNEQVKAQGRNQIVTVATRDEEPVIEITTILYWRNQQTIGYLIAELNNSSAIYGNLTLQDTTYPTYAFLVTADGALISPEESRAQADIAANSSAVRRALSGEIGLETYRVSSDVPEVIGYFAPIPDTPLAFVVEAQTSYAATTGRAYFDTRLFVIAAATVALIIVIIFFFNQIVAPPLARLRHATQSLSEGNFDVPVPDANRADEIGELAASFVSMREQVQSLIGDLEARIATRARDMSATQEISRFAVSQRDLQTLMDSVVNLIVERFASVYHAQIFLLDNDREYAVLRASTGDVGQSLIARGHRLAVGSVSVIGQVTAQGRVVIARDTATSTVHRRNEFLPETVAELAIPLRVGNDLIGALDVQSKQRDAFNPDLVNVLQTMADQIAIAIQNARLYQESVRRLEEVERSNRIATRGVWQEYMRGLRARQLSSETGTHSSDFSSLREQAFATGQIAIGDVTQRNTIPIAVPVKLRGQPLGAVEWEIPASQLDENKLQLAQDLANRLAVSLDNARLFEESQRATERERVVNDIAAKLTAQTDIDLILQTAVREVGQALRAPGVTIRLSRTTDEANGHHGENGHSNGNGNHP